MKQQKKCGNGEVQLIITVSADTPFPSFEGE